ncbi:ester cyclase [Rhodoferax sp.]|uniref:ester cyclase n=1 Tax=Rhodoferax sp. TaxID=50421 RepID=UPI00261F492A|nr:ester cyclase [Rhodoferax sp.]MDD2925824.1 ester cyclase [Rhodoferax sp.]
MNMISKLAAQAVLATLVATGAASAQTITLEQAHALLDPFYAALDRPATKDIRALVEQALSPDWKSYANDTDFKGREAFINQMVGLAKSVPDMRWEVRDMLVSGNRVIVRSMASGTPQGQFMGMPVAGNKSFAIMAIDIHTIADGQGILAHHVEDWASAMRQLKP